MKLKKQDKFIINFAPTGIVPTREMTPHVPLTVEEIARDVASAFELGAQIVHLHARDPHTGQPTSDRDVYRRLILEIRENTPGVLICVSTSGRISSSFDDRSAVLTLSGDEKPDFASLMLGSVNFTNQAGINNPGMIKDLLTMMLDRNIRPEFELFDLGMVNYLGYLIEHFPLERPYFMNLILGNIAGAQADVLSLGSMVAQLPNECIFCIGGIGAAQLPANMLGLIAGQGVRVGIEDSIWFDQAKTRLASNAELVQRITVLARALSLSPYSLAEFRMLLHLDREV